MKNVALFALCGCMVFGEARADELPQVTPMDVGLSAEKLERVKTLVQGALDKSQTAGMIILIARQGKVAYWETFGRGNAATDKPMPKDAIFRIHSMTKPITTAAALLLYEEGKFKLDDPVSQYLPKLKGLRVHTGKGGETVAAKHEMTIRDLMRHTAGLTYGMPNGTAVDKMYLAKGIDGPGLSLAEMVTALGQLPLQDQPGTRFHYSIATDVLARLIEVLSDKPIDEFLQDRLCRPLDLRDTGFLVPDDKLSRLTAVKIRRSPRSSFGGRSQAVGCGNVGSYHATPLPSPHGACTMNTITKERVHERHCRRRSGQIQECRLRPRSGDGRVSFHDLRDDRHRAAEAGRQGTAGRGKPPASAGAIPAASPLVQGGAGGAGGVFQRVMLGHFACLPALSALKSTAQANRIRLTMS